MYLYLSRREKVVRSSHLCLLWGETAEKIVAAQQPLSPYSSHIITVSLAQQPLEFMSLYSSHIITVVTHHKGDDHDHDHESNLYQFRKIFGTTLSFNIFEDKLKVVWVAVVKNIRKGIWFVFGRYYFNPAKNVVISCPGQLNRWHCHWVSESLSWLLISASSEHCRAVVDRCDLSDNEKTKAKTKTKTKTKGVIKWSTDLVTQLTIPDKLRNWIMALRVGDWQSESDLDSIRNSCDVWWKPMPLPRPDICH